METHKNSEKASRRLFRQCSTNPGASLYHRLIPLIPSCLLVLATSCYSVKKTVEESKPYSAEIQWPDQYLPESSVFFVHNEIDIQAEPLEVWEVLIAAETWEEWYEGAANVEVVGSESGRLEANSVFTWKTMGQDFTSSVREFQAPFRLSWESEKKNISGYHAWLIVPTEEGCKLITSESQHGFLAGMEKVFIPNKLRKLHDIWLAEIKNKAENKEL